MPHKSDWITLEAETFRLLGTHRHHYMHHYVDQPDPQNMAP